MSYTDYTGDTAYDEMVLVSGRATPDLAECICSHLNVRMGRMIMNTFSDGEVQVEFRDNIRGKDIYIIQSVCTPVSHSLMELSLIADAARRSSAQSITAVVPYLGYARQDRRPRGDRTPISARVVADILTTVGISRLVTIDLHAEQIQGFYNFPVDNIYASSVLLGDLTKQMKGIEEVPLLVSPDIGGVARARAIARQIDADLAIVDKRRPRANVSEVVNIIGKVKGRDCFLVDDIADTAGTLCSATNALLQKGAKSVSAYCTHPVFSGPAIERLNNSQLKEVVVTDTIPLSEEAKKCVKIRSLSVAELLAETISRIQGRQSVGSLFMD